MIFAKIRMGFSHPDLILYHEFYHFLLAARALLS